MGNAMLREKHEGVLPDTSSVRLWLRLLSCTTIAEKRLRRRFADQFGTTLPRFDVLAALDREERGLSMGELSQRLLVSSGNVTAIVQQLVRQQLVEVRTAASDRRTSIVTLTSAGRADFATLADAHHHWIEEMFGPVPVASRERLFALLAEVKHALAEQAS